MSENVASPEASSPSPGCDYLCATHTCGHTGTLSHLLQEPGRRAILSLPALRAQRKLHC